MTGQNLNESLVYLDTVEYRQHPDIANSDLKYLKSPKKFKLYKEKKLEEESPEDYQKLGTLIDLFLLDKAKFAEKCYVVEDAYTTPSSPNQNNFVDLYLQGLSASDAYLNSYKVSEKDIKSGDYYTKATELFNSLERHLEVLKLAKTKTIVDAKDYALLCNIELAVVNHVEANRLLLSPDKGWEVIKHFRRTGVNYFDVDWKGELDVVILDHINMIAYNVDLKSTSYLSSFEWDYKKYHYERQQALYEILLKDFLKEKFPLVHEKWVIKTRVIAVETTGLNEVAVIPIPSTVLEKGREQIVESAATIKWHRDNNLWDYPMSYYQNEGLQLIEWENVYS